MYVYAIFFVALVSCYVEPQYVFTLDHDENLEEVLLMWRVEQHPIGNSVKYFPIFPVAIQTTASVQKEFREIVKGGAYKILDNRVGSTTPSTDPDRDLVEEMTSSSF